MADELAKKVSETLNRKPNIPEDELADALEEIARDIALIETDQDDLGEKIDLCTEKYRLKGSILPVNFLHLAL